MSLGLFPELEDMLDNQWISLRDCCALFAGFCPLEPYVGDWGDPDRNRRYKRITDGKEIKPSKADFIEMERFFSKWNKSNFDITTNSRYPNMSVGHDTEISTRFAFKIGLGFRPLDERITNLYDAAVEAGLLPREPSIPIEELFNNLDMPLRQSQSPMQDNLIQITKLEPGLTAGSLLERWEKVKPYYINEIIPAKKKSEQTYIYYKIKHTTHSSKEVVADYDQLEKAVRRAYKFNNKFSK